MKSAMVKGFAILAVVLLFAGSSLAVQPGSDVNPNGFPSGPHFNLNIIGKKAGFTCPAPEIDPLTGATIYGNVVFVPLSGTGIQIMMQSGNVKGKWATTAPTELQAIDPCTSDFDGTPAVIQLPPNASGYKVYARALATPNPGIMAIVPELAFVQDELGNDLVYLGLVTSTGFVKADGETFTRTKGKSVAVPITGLFQWTGTVCYFSEMFCDSQCTSGQLCCTDANSDGIYGSCVEPVDSICPAGSTLVDVFCRTYTAEWVFNIGDFVNYIWSIDNTGLKLLQVRFYPQ